MDSFLTPVISAYPPSPSCSPPLAVRAQHTRPLSPSISDSQTQTQRAMSSESSFFFVPFLRPRMSFITGPAIVSTVVSGELLVIKSPTNERKFFPVPVVDERPISFTGRKPSLLLCSFLYFSFSCSRFRSSMLVNCFLYRAIAANRRF